MSSTVLLPLRASTLRRTKSRAPSRVVRAAGVGETRVFRGIDPRQLVAPTIGHTVLVTGGTSGIGWESSRQLYEAGCRVIVAGRTEEKAGKAVKSIVAASGTTGTGSLEAVGIDLADLSSIKKFVDDVAYESFSAIVLNAGVAPDRAAMGMAAGPQTAKRTKQGFEETIGVNHLGHFLLCQGLLPKLLSTAGARKRIVITSGEIHNAESPDGRNGAVPTLGDLSGLESGPDFEMCDGGDFDGNKAYKDSKLCGVLFARELARRLRDSLGDDADVVCNAFSPGFVPTSGLFRNQSAPVQALLKFAFNYPPLATSLETAGMLTTHMVLGRNTGETQGAYYCGPPDYYLPEEGMVYGFLRGIFAPEFGEKSPSFEAMDARLGRRLWELSEELVGTKFDVAPQDRDREGSPVAV